MSQSSFSGKYPRKPFNSDVRPREYLTEAEVALLRKAARHFGRHGHRDDTLILLAYRHGLRVSEVVSLHWAHVDLDKGRLDVHRRKNGVDTSHPLTGAELRALRRLRRDYDRSPYVFESERGAPLSTDGVRKLVKRAGDRAGFEFPVHPHMLRHACGYKLANDGVDTRTLQHYLGHQNIQHTVKYTQLAAHRFQGLWQD